MSGAHEAEIRHPVGAGGTNREQDVRIVQDLLNRAARASLIAVDGRCGPATRREIFAFQRGVVRDPDGRIDPHGVTFTRLLHAAGGWATGGTGRRGDAEGPADGMTLRALPRRERAGYYSYAAAERQYGTEELLRVIMRAAATLQDAGFEVGVGDLSFAQGGAMPPHSRHKDGRDADLRPVRSDGRRGPTRIGEATYSHDGTATLVRVLRAESSVAGILFNDRDIEGVRHWPGHDNHLHVSVR